MSVSRRGEVSYGNTGHGAKPSPAPPHCHHRLRTHPTGAQRVNSCFKDSHKLKRLLPVQSCSLSTKLLKRQLGENDN